jgi:hypothetical protein
VAAGPLGDDIGDDAAVVVGAEHELVPRGPGGVNSVHPEVTQVDRVDEVAECPRLDDGPVDLHLHPAQERRQLGALAHGDRGDRRQTLDHLGWAELETLTHLDR